MRDKLLQFEKKFSGLKFISLLILTPAIFLQRVLWLWGRLRFSALVRNRGHGCVCHWNADLKYPENLVLGDDVVIGVNASLGAHSPIHIGHRVRISKDVQIETAGLDFLSGPPPYRHMSKPIFIEEGVWIGTRSIVLGGVRIGAHSVVAAGSIVTRDVPPRTLVAGMPAKVLRQLPDLRRDDKL
ncbi:MAG: acetyltransferase [Comamonadaceae bacterium PBBC2]|nr:MAG: acetyltransferase [Comamonadaceae bacterium PBBC2]